MKAQSLIVLSLALAITVHAGSATWKTRPPSGDWNNAANWTPETVPNGPADIATFATTRQNLITPTEPTEVNSIVFNSGATAFFIKSGAGAPLTISGTGVVNDSGLTQLFASPAGPLPIFFTNSASAGEQTTFNNTGAELSGGLGGLTQFSGTATAGSATLNNFGTSQTGGASGGMTEFLDNSTAGQGSFVNNGGTAPIAHAGTTIFRGNSTAGTGTFTNNESTAFGFPGTTYFYDTASADHGIFINNGSLAFFNSSTAGNGTFTIGGSDGFGVVDFQDTATAADGNFTIVSGQIHVRGSVTLGNATITANHGSVDLNDITTADHATLIANGGTVARQGGGGFGFGEGSTAAEATLIINPGTVTDAVGGAIGLGSGASAGDSIITVNGAAVTGDLAEGLLTFSSSAKDANATAANATIIATGGSNGGRGAEIQFLRDAFGGTCRIELLGNSQLDLVPDRMHDLTIGSLAGEGRVFLGGHGLFIGSNNLSTTFAGKINDGQGAASPPGFLSKIGTGTLELAGATSYTGGTTVFHGTLLVTNITGSATGTGPVILAAGTLGGGGIISGSVTVGSGSGAAAFLEPSAGSSQPTELTIQGLVTFKSDGTYTYKLSTKKANADQVVANGVTIESGARFNFRSIGTRQLAVGRVFTAISNTATTPINGTFSNLPDGSTLTIGSNTFQVDYEGGDGNDLTLTVVP